MTTTCVPRNGSSDCVGARALSAGIFISSRWRRTFCIAARSLAGSLGIESLRMTGNPEVISSPVGLVPTNALVLNGPLNSQIVYTEVSLEAVVQKRGSGKCARTPDVCHLTVKRAGLELAV